MLAHELRNPLASIFSLLEIMKRADGDAEGRRHTRETMEQQLHLMRRLLDDLLDINRITRGKVELRTERMELAPLVRRAVNDVRPLCESNGHELTVLLPSEPLYLNADPTRLAQVLGNLLNNASKYTPRGGRIWLIIERQDQQVVIRVEDNGIGIAAEQQPHLFEMFRQVDVSMERSLGGLGLGLTIVKSLVEMHGGSVEASSAGISHGAAFIVRLPLLIDATLSQGQEQAEINQTAIVPRRVVIVDDNRMAANSLSRLLQLDGHESYAAYDGLEAVELVAKVQPEVVLLDIGLPKLNGYEVARRVRAAQREKRVLLVALTGWGQEEVRRQGEEAGFDLHMTKPVDYAALEKVLAEMGVPT
ncbi:MAG: ATP-binding protein [Candidatus Binatia bacterium]